MPERRLTTHVLDIAAGRPAAGVEIELRRSGEDAVLARVRTNADGRTDAPLLSGEALVPGEYELTFHAGAYLAAAHPAAGGSPPFLSTIPVRFGVGEDGGNLHVPLLLAAHGYSTYRGS